MPFIGTPTFKMVTDGIIRITGLSMGSQESARIGLFGCLASPDLTLPEQFRAREYSYPVGHAVSIPDAVSVEVNFVSLLGSPAGPIAIGKVGTTVENFQIQLATPVIDEEEGIPQLEIYVRYHE